MQAKQLSMMLFWCLFNKDSKERTKIQWRPLDENSEPIRGKQTSVTSF